MHTIGLENKILSLCLRKAMPFVAYRMPESSKIKLLLGLKLEPFVFQGQNICSQKGFVIVPFDNEHQQAYIISAQFEADFSNYPTETLNFLEALPDKELQLNQSLNTSAYDDYKQEFTAMHKAIQEGVISKAILSRCQLEAQTNISDIASYYLQLCETCHTTYNYLLYTPETGLWMGASPEVFLRGNQEDIETVSLAGTLKKDQQAQWADKELAEQDIVTDYISEQLEQFEVKAYSKHGPMTVHAGHVSHLKTIFRFPRTTVESHLGQFVEALHPTPAVCGYPKDKSKSIILETENHERGLYAGFLGAVAENGDFDFFVNIRCLQYFKDATGIYVGGGITAKSELEKEYQETQLKAEGLLKILNKK